jgi:tetratricopeptide (TPR) repeat protein
MPVSHDGRIGPSGATAGIVSPQANAASCALASAATLRDTSCTPTFPPGRIATLFTPQQLFGEFETSTDVLVHAAFLERARREREREREASARLALGGYVVARLVNRMLALPEGDPEAREGFVWQMEAVRRHLRDLPGDAPESAHLSGIAEAVPATGKSSPGLRLTLTAYAYFLEHEGRLEEALDVLTLASHTHGPTIAPAEYAAAALFAGRLNRLLARWERATTCYAAAESAAQLSRDTVTGLRSRLGRAAVLRGQGNLPLAKTSVEAVIERAEALGLREVLTIAYADLGAVCDLQGQYADAVQAIYRAFLTSDDSLQRMRVLGDLGIDLRKVGAFEAARLAFEIVVASNTSFLVRTNAVLELMELEALVGNQVAFQRRRAQAEEVRERMTPSMACDFLFKAGSGLLGFGRSGKARELLVEGRDLAEEHQLNAWYFRFDRALTELETSVAREPEPATWKARLSELPAIREVAVGLREYALQAT